MMKKAITIFTILMVVFCIAFDPVRAELSESSGDNNYDGGSDYSQSYDDDEDRDVDDDYTEDYSRRDNASNYESNREFKSADNSGILYKIIAAVLIIGLVIVGIIKFFK